MAEKNFLSWLGFKDEETIPPSVPSSAKAESGIKATIAPSSGQSTFERIRELEAELADLRARRDITSLTREEFEILATETATSLIKTAQARAGRQCSPYAPLTPQRETSRLQQ